MTPKPVLSEKELRAQMRAMRLAALNEEAERDMQYAVEYGRIMDAFFTKLLTPRPAK